MHRKDSEGKDFTMASPSKSGAMSHKHGEVFYPLERGREGVLPPGPAVGTVTNGKIGIPAARQGQRKIREDMLPRYIHNYLPKDSRGPGATRNKAQFKHPEDWTFHITFPRRLPSSSRQSDQGAS